MRKLKAYKQYFPFPPIAKGRAVVPAGRPAFTPKRTRDFERAIADGWTLGKLDGKLYAVVNLYADHIEVELGQLPTDTDKRPLRGDLDNYLKAIFDGLQGVAFDNDRQVQYIVCVLGEDDWSAELGMKLRGLG